MLVSVQFPFADSRAFLTQKIKLLGRPTWPAASPYTDFVRSFGMITTRKLGGLPGWVGENVLCEADRALRFSKITNYKEPEGAINIPLTIAFRRLYFDGLAVGKFEVGLSTENARNAPLNSKQADEFIKHCLDLQVVIPALSTKAVLADGPVGPTETSLGEAGRPLSKFYAAATLAHPPPVKVEDWWVLSGTPALFLIHESSERINFGFRGKKLPRIGYPNAGFDLSHYEVPYKGRDLRMWVVRLNPRSSYRDARALKICLLRLHAEHESMRLVLQNISSNNVLIVPRTNQSNTLQYYLNEATKRISRLGSQADLMSKRDLAELARESEDLVGPGDRDSLLATLQNLNVRRNIFNKVQDYVNAEIHVKELYMAAKYNISGGTQGAVGDNAEASNNNFNTWNQSGGDLSELAGQLRQLRAELGKQANSPEQFEVAATVARAEAAAEEGDGPAVFDHLKSAGKWALETATSIGVPVAIQALKSAIGV